MPKKSESKGSTTKKEKQTEYDDKELPKVNASEFDVKNYKVDIMKENTSPEFKEARQHTLFPRYKYETEKETKKDSKKGDNEKADGESGQYERCVIVTKPIKMVKGGLPKLDGKWRNSENECQYFWLPLEGSDGAVELRDKVMAPMDKHNSKKINDEKNKSGFISKVTKSGKTVPFKDLEYVVCHKLSPKNDNKQDNDDDDDESDDDKKKSKSKDDKKSKDGDRYLRVKVKLHTAYDKDADPKDERKIKTKVFINDKSGDPKREPEKVTCMTDLRKLFEWNCTAQFVLEFNKFWITKQANKNDKYECSVSVKCLGMYIIERPKTSKSASVGGIGIFGVTPKQVEDGHASDGSDDSGSDSENEKSAKKNDKKKDSDDESESDASDSDDDKKAKGKNKKGSDSDNDSDEDKKPKGKDKGKGKNTKGSDSDDSDEEDKKSKGKTKDTKKKEESDSDEEDSKPKGKEKDAKKESKSKKAESDSDDSGDESVTDSDSEDEKPKKETKGGKNTKSKGK